MTSVTDIRASAFDKIRAYTSANQIAAVAHLGGTSFQVRKMREMQTRVVAIALTDEEVNAITGFEPSYRPNNRQGLPDAPANS